MGEQNHYTIFWIGVNENKASPNLSVGGWKVMFYTPKRIQIRM